MLGELPRRLSTIRYAGRSSRVSIRPRTSSRQNAQKMPGSAYDPLRPAKRPGSSPAVAPKYRILVDRRYADLYSRMADAVGIQQAQRFWDHVAATPNEWPRPGNSCILRGTAGLPQGPGWSRTIHYELSSMAR